MEIKHCPHPCPRCGAGAATAGRWCINEDVSDDLCSVLHSGSTAALQHCSTLATLRRMLQTPAPGPAWPSSPGPSAAPAMDLIVTASGTPVPCSRAALTACSGYFAAQLQLAGAAVTSLDLPTVPADIFKLLLLQVYTGRLEVTADNVYQLFWYSQMLQMPSAVLQCSHYISSKLSSPALTSTSTTAAEEEKPRSQVVKPIARPGVPLVPAVSYPQLLRPHLATFYSDWFLRYTSLSSLTRQSFTKKEEKKTVPTSTSLNHSDSKENEGSN